MKRVIRKGIFLVFVLAMLLTALMTFSSAANVVASGYCGGEGDGTNLEWILDNKGTLTITGTGAMKNYASSNNLPWYSKRSSVKEVIICDGVTTLSKFAFSGYTNLTSAEIPSSVTNIGSCAFSSCAGLTSIKIPYGVTTIGSQAFSSCTGLVSVEIANSVTAIRYGAFSYCSNLTYVEIPNSVTSISASTFAECTRLTTITVHEGNLTYCDDNGILFSKDKTILHSYPAGKPEKSYEIPKGVTTIGGDAFWACNNLTSIKIPNSVTAIEYGAFSQCAGLSSVEIPSSVTIINDATFQNCTSLVSIKIPSSVTKISYFAFGGCTKLASIEIPGSVTCIDDQAFNKCSNLTNVYFSGNAPTVTASSSNDPSFDGAVTLYYIPSNTGWADSVAYDAETNTWNGYSLAIWTEKNYLASGHCGGEGDGTNLEWTLDKGGTLSITGTGRMKNYSMHNDDMPWFQYMDEINTIVIGEGISEIGEDAFSYANVKQVYLPNSLIKLNSCAFYACNYLTEIELPESLTYIGRGVFYGCDRLEEITIPKAVSFIGDSALITCSRLKNIYVASDNEYYADEDGVLFDKSKTYLHSFPTGRSGQYRIPQGVEAVGSYAFRYAEKLVNVEFPDSLTKISDGAFSFCSSLENVDIGANISYIGSGVWVGCKDLLDIRVSEKNEYYCDIEGVLFSKDKSTLVMYPAGRTGTYSVPVETKTIAASSFGSGLISGISISENVESIGSYAFRSCDSLTEINIPLNVSDIWMGAFEYCSNLRLVTFEGLDVSFAQNAFRYCHKDLSLVAHSGSKIEEYANANNQNYVWNQHEWDTKFTVDVPPTCTVAGTQSIHCLDCVVSKDVKEISATGHIPSSMWTFNDSAHWKVCSSSACQAILDTTKEAHHGGTADCVNLAICVDCGQAYGKLTGHTPVKFSGQPATCTDDGWFGYYQCSCCKAFFSDEDCTAIIDDLDVWKSGNGKITANGHTASSVWSFNSDEHWKLCSDPSCQAILDTTKETHHGGSADCVNLAICVDCEQAYGRLVGHTPVKFSGQSATCTEDGWFDHYQCSCCKEIFSDEACTTEIGNLDTWKTTEGKIGARGHAFSSDWNYNATEHWHDAICGHDVVSDLARHDYGRDRICDTCGRRMTSSGTQKPQKPQEPVFHPNYPFADLDVNAWYYEGILYCLENGLMNGIGNGKFDPNGTTLRTMVVTVLWRMEGCPIVNYPLPFTDVANTWYTEAIRWAASEGLVSGYGNGTFGVNDQMTREQMVSIMWRYAKHKGYDVSVGENTNILSYGDAFNIAEWAIPAMQWACGISLVRGIEDQNTMNIVPHGNSTRAQTATMLYRFCNTYLQ